MMKSKVNHFNMLSVLIIGLFLLNLIVGGCSKKDNTSSAMNLINTSNYPIVGTNQTIYYDSLHEMAAPAAGSAFYGQNAMYPGNTPNYVNNADGTITDKVTGLMWQQTEDRNGDGVINFYDKLTYSQALTDVAACTTGGHNDWRVPTIKELYSLVMSSGTDLNPQSPSPPLPFINTNYFGFGYGDTSSLAHGDLGTERPIDAQVVTSTLYVSTTMNGIECVFGYNFADGRIKAYPTTHTVPEDGQAKRFYVLYVRGNSNYGQNNFKDNADSTITDNATGLMWAKYDSHSGMNWQAALAWAQAKNQANYCGHNDWRIPDVKELHSIVDYTRSPATTNSAAIDPVFSCTSMTNEGGNADFPWYWSSTTFCEGAVTNGGSACYICFGRAMGYFNGYWLDVHGAGAQRSDPKGGNLSSFTHVGNGYYNPQAPQGDAVRIFNYVRLVRNAGK
jgi:hypothetical protein